ncbi:DUF4112 domain-containing protein [Mesorhizobium australicum]
MLDTVVGSIPVLGSIFDVYFKSNNRKLRCFAATLVKPKVAADDQLSIRPRNFIGLSHVLPPNQFRFR